jgi:hypothetical protein
VETGDVMRNRTWTELVSADDLDDSEVLRLSALAAKVQVIARMMFPHAWWDLQSE